MRCRACSSSSWQFAAKNAARVAAALADWPRAENAERDARRDCHLASALVYENSGDRDAAARQYAAALRQDPACEAAARALLSGVGPEGSAEILSALAEVCVDNGLAALLLIEAALRRGTENVEAFEALLHRAADSYPSLPLPHRLGEQLARQRGDADSLLRWIRLRRDAAHDPIEQALDRVREALLVADGDMPGAAALVEQALAARPQDLALHELHERLAGGAATERGRWRENLAADVESPMAGRLLLEAAFEYERGGDVESAARAALAATERGSSELAKVTADRLAASSSTAARLAERLLERAREEADPVAQRELYERLSVLDRSRGDHSSALLWQTAILEGTPGYLPALRRLEHAYIGSGRDEELEPIASNLAKLLDVNEGSAHALLVGSAAREERLVDSGTRNGRDRRALRSAVAGGFTSAQRPRARGRGRCNFARDRQAPERADHTAARFGDPRLASGRSGGPARPPGRGASSARPRRRARSESPGRADDARGSAGRYRRLCGRRNRARGGRSGQRRSLAPAP